MTDWLEPLPPDAETRHRRHNDVYHDPRYEQAAKTGKFESIEAPTRIVDWVLPHETHDALFRAGHGTAPDLIYAKRIPDTPSPDPNIFNRKKCNLILIEVGFCRDFGCHTKIQKKTTKYAPLVTFLKAVYEKV